MRAHLRKATSISVAVDESDGRKLVRVRCDMPERPYRFNGVMGVLHKSFKNKDIAAVKEAVMEDHAKVALESLQRFHKRFFTVGSRAILWGKRLQKKRKAADGAISGASSLGLASSSVAGQVVAPHVASTASSSGTGPPVATGSNLRKGRGKKRAEPTLDAQGLEDYRRKVRTLASDGGPSERRTLFLSATAEEFPNADYVVKDMIHCIRIATQKPLHLTGECAQVFQDIIDKRHAFLPDLQNSNKWKAIFEAVQESLTNMPAGNIPQVLTRSNMQCVFKHLAFAKHRMDSCADPLAKVCMLLLPIAILLSLVSCDARNQKEQRERASALLTKFQPKFMMATGVSADWGLIAADFLNLFDAGDHDISNSADEEDAFDKIFRSVFIRGGVFHETRPETASASGEVAAEFMTERVRKQIVRRCVFRCGEKHQMIWGPIRQDDLAALSQETRVAAKTTLDRIHADMAGLRRDFACFSFKRIRAAIKSGAASGASLRENLLVSLNRLARVFRLDRRMLKLEYEDAQSVMLKAFEALEPGHKGTWKSFPNWQVWQNILDNAWVAKHFPGRIAPFCELSKLTRILISILDGESEIERDFAHVRSFVQTSKNLGEPLLDDLAVLKLSGPQSSQELASKSACGDYVPTGFVLECAAAWRQLYGARCGIGTGQRKTRPATQKQGKGHKVTFRAIKSSVMRAAQTITHTFTASETAPQVPRSYGVDSTFFVPPVAELKEKTPVWNAHLQKFSDLSKKKKTFNELGRCGRSSFPKWKHRAGYSNEATLPYISCLSFMPSLQAATTTGTKTASEYENMGYTVLQGVHTIGKASLLIIDSLERLQGPCPSQEWVAAFLYMVAKGIRVTTVACCNSVGGDVRKLPRANLLEHVPATDRYVEFIVHADFKRQFGDILRALRECASASGGNWRIGKTSACGDKRLIARQPACGSESANDAAKKKSPQKMKVEIETLPEMWTFLQQSRRLRNGRSASIFWISDEVGL
jgi:hypothetical protein